MLVLAEPGTGTVVGCLQATYLPRLGRTLMEHALTRAGARG
ncbi:hypothetical protein ABZ923_24445 [Streptomyces sp. NPDC046881]